MKVERRRPFRPLLFVIPVAIGAFSGLTCHALTMAHERAGRKMCASRLRCISYGCHLYSSDFAEAFPKSLGELYRSYITDGVAFLCPRTDKAVVLEDEFRFIEDRDNDGERYLYSLDRWGAVDHEFIGPDEPFYTPAKFGDTHSDYVYVSGVRASDPASYVQAFDDEWNHDGAGVNVLFVGANAEWVTDFTWLHEQLAKQDRELAAQGRTMKLLRPAWSSWPGPPPGGHPLWGPQPWHRRRSGPAVLVGVFAALAVVLLLVVRTVRRGRKPGSDNAAQHER